MEAITATTTDVTKQAQRAVCEAVEQAEGKDILVLISGGSAFQLLTLELAQQLHNRVTIGMIDERYTKDPFINNFWQLTALPFYKKGQDQGCQWIDTRLREDESHDEFTARLNDGLRQWFAEHADGVVIAILGMGADGHTAGIFPHPAEPETFSQLFEQPGSLLVGYDAQNKNQYPLRTTVTLDFLRTMVDVAIIYVTGEQKKIALQQVLSEQGDIARTPARVFHEISNATLFTDIQT